MLHLVIFQLDERDGPEVAINPALVESVTDRGATADVRMTSGCIHRVKQRGDRSVRDWLTNASVELRKRLEEAHPLRDVPGSIFPAGSRVGLDMGSGESRSVEQRREGKTPLRGRPLDDNGAIDLKVGGTD